MESLGSHVLGCALGGSARERSSDTNSDFDGRWFAVELSQTKACQTTEHGYTPSAPWYKCNPRLSCRFVPGSGDSVAIELRRDVKIMDPISDAGVDQRLRSSIERPCAVEESIHTNQCFVDLDRILEVEDSIWDTQSLSPLLGGGGCSSREDQDQSKLPGSGAR